MAKTVIVVPCFNEAARLPARDFLAFSEKHPDLRFLFVNDGSTDDTAAVLRALEDRNPAQLALLDCERNRGKAEAVRSGMRAAAEEGAAYAGYWDADLSTPLAEVLRFVAHLDGHPETEIVFGSRVKLLGRTIERRALRHYLGRVFATVASEALGLAVYDTQCGAKLFRMSPGIAALFAEPFSSRWIFAGEKAARLSAARRDGGGARPSEVIYELPLREWRDVPGSKVRTVDFFLAIYEIWLVHRRYLRGTLRRVERGADDPATPRR